MATKKFTRLTPIDASFGERLHAFREAAGMSLRDLSFDGCSPGYISRLENGTRSPSLQLIVGLADKLGITGVELLGLAPTLSHRDSCPLCRRPL